MHKKRKKQNKKISKKMKIISYFFIFIVLLLFSFLIAMIVYNYIDSKLETKNNKIENNKENTEKDKINNNKNTQKKENTELEEILGVIEDINYSTKKLKIFNIKENISNDFFVNSTTTLKGKYGKIKNLLEFEEGNIVDIKYLKKDNTITYISESKRSWLIESVKNINIDKKNKTIKIGKDTLNYSENLNIKYQDKNYNIDFLNESSILNLKGVDDTVFYIEVLKGAGKLKIINYDNIEKGILEIGNKNIISLDNIKDTDINITEGNYKIILKGKNIETYIENINIVNEEITVLNLKDIIYNSSALTIYLNIPNAKVTIDNKIVDVSKIQNLPYGEYIIKAELEGYELYENKIKINKPIENLNIVLEEEAKSKYIDIITSPPDAQIFIDEEYKGKSPLKISLDFGKKSIVVKKQGYLDVSFPCEINKTTDKYSINLIPEIN